ncbi:MAG TPA: thiamine pyrophosphate-binding protein [Polyangiaceae bacterium]|nr:thiamine pyrophosphate-binding protein [Polyangiaceae bacterium]
MTDCTVAQLFAELLESEGVDCVFVVPGGTIVPLMEAVSRRSNLRVVVSKDESGAAYAADGYSWATGKLGVVITIGGPGATNAITALCCSAAQRHPLILISGEVSTSSMGRRAVQDGTDLGLDVLAISRPATALSALGSTPEKAIFALQEGLRRALHERRPVHLSLPLDVQRARSPALVRRNPAQYRAARTAVCDSDALRRATALLRAAERPALLVGSGARGAAGELLMLAERLQSPVATTCGAKGLFPEYHPLSVGCYSFGSGPLARAAMTDKPDVLCAIGTGLGEFATLNFSAALEPSRALIHIDLDPAVIGRNYESVGVCADAQSAIARLIAELGPEKAPANPWLEQLARAHGRFSEEHLLTSEAVPIRPERVMREVEGALPVDACVVADIGTSCLFVAHYLRLQAPQRCYIPMAWSCMGHPLAASIGVRLGSGSPTLCVTGDAAFLAEGLELHAAVEAGVERLVWVVLSNRGHGLVRAGTEMLLGPNHGVEAGDFKTRPDIAGIARAVGADAYLVEHPEALAPALSAAFTGKRPVVVDVRVEPEAVPPMADRIQGLRARASD